MVMQRRIDDCCIGDTIPWQEGDSTTLVIRRESLSYVPSPSQMTTWGRSLKPLKFRRVEVGLLRYE